MKSKTLWVLAVAITLVSAAYQRMTGPTYPLKGKTTLEGKSVSYSLIRTHAGEGDAIVRIPLAFAELTGDVSWRRHKTADAWTRIPLVKEGDHLVARLPHQPPAGKLDYRVGLQAPSERVLLQGGRPVTVRFRGDVPALVLVPHVILMFASMLFSTRAGLECLRPKPGFAWLVHWTLITLFVGGLLLGPIVQKYAFGELWTGWPFGHDLTDNKTAVAFLAWSAAWAAIRKWPQSRWPVATAAVVTLVVFALPHSMWGSELDYSKK